MTILLDPDVVAVLVSRLTDSEAEELWQYGGDTANRMAYCIRTSEWLMRRFPGEWKQSGKFWYPAAELN